MYIRYLVYKPLGSRRKSFYLPKTLAVWVLASTNTTGLTATVQHKKCVGHVFRRTRRIHLILIRIIISLVPSRRLQCKQGVSAANAISDFHGVVYETKTEFKHDYFVVWYLYNILSVTLPHMRLFI